LKADLEGFGFAAANDGDAILIECKPLAVVLILDLEG
jgi:hypothetical protein